MKTRELVIKEGIKAFFENDYIGTLVYDPGTGKSKLALDIIAELGVRTVLITSPRTHLKNNWLEEIMKWGDAQVFQSSDHKFRCSYKEHAFDVVIENIQTMYKRSREYISTFDFIVFDEIHTYTTEKYGELVRIAYNLNISRLGLTGTPDIKEKDFKTEFYEKYCPILYIYNSAAEDGIINQKKIIALFYELPEDFSYTVRTKRKFWNTSEAKHYSYLQKTIDEISEKVKSDWPDEKVLGLHAVYAIRRKDIDPNLKTLLIKYWWAIKERKTLLWSLKSSAFLAGVVKQELLKDKNNKILIFSELTEKADILSKWSVHSNKSDQHNRELLEKFNLGRIRELSSCQSLTLGLNLEGANKAIFESYNSTFTNNTQKQGRLHRLSPDKTATLYYIIPMNTQAQVWFESAMDTRIYQQRFIENIKKFKL